MNKCTMKQTCGKNEYCLNDHPAMTIKINYLDAR